MKKKIPINAPCPCCQKPMEIASHHCRDCDVELRGEFEKHPFAQLSGEWLHFLHVFVMCEGKIGDMEKALGVSYPTVKAKMAKLKEMMSIEEDRASNAVHTQESVIMEVLKGMEEGSIEYGEGLNRIKKLKNLKG